MAYKKPQPQLRDGVTETMRRIIINYLLPKNTASLPYRNCLNCSSWNFDMDGCNKFQQKPPTEIIVYSCEQYTDNDDDIPF